MEKSLVKNSLYNVLYRIISALYPLIAVTYVSHILQADRMGQVSYAQNIVSYFTTVAVLGLPSYGIREIAKVSGDKKNRSKLFFELFTINGISTTFSLVIYTMMIMNVKRFQDNIFLYSIVGIQILLNYFSVDWFYQGMEEYKYISIRSIIVKIISIILLPLFIHTPEDYLIYAFIYCLAIAGNNFFNIYKIRNYVSLPKEKLNIIIHLKPVFILLAATMAVEIYAVVDTTMLGIFCNDAVVGCYTNAMKLTRMITTTTSAMGAVLLPRLSRIYNKDNSVEFCNMINSALKIMLMIAIPAEVGLIILREEIVFLFFGETFIEAIPILGILSVMIPIIVCNSILGGQVLITIGKEKEYVFALLVAAITNISLNSIFIPKFGAVAAAIASIISEIVDLVLYLYFSKNVIQIKFPMKDIFSSIVSLLIYIILALIINPLIKSDYITIIINMIVCCILYFGIGFLCKNTAILFAYEKLLIILKVKKGEK